jgi:hypothetical protein
MALRPLQVQKRLKPYSHETIRLSTPERGREAFRVGQSRLISRPKWPVEFKANFGFYPVEIADLPL